MLLVSAVPAVTPFSEKPTDRPITAAVVDRSVAVKIAKPPYGPDEGETTRVVAPAAALMVMEADAELLAAPGSTADLLAMVAESARVVPLIRLAAVWATRVTVSVVPLAIEENEAVWGFRTPVPQTPVPVAAQETSDVPAGSVSAIVAAAASGPAFATLTVYVTLEPATTVVGEAVMLSDRSAVEHLRGG